MRAIDVRDVRIHDDNWSAYKRLVREVVIPYQWEALNDHIPGAEPSHAVRNMRIAAGFERGEFQGFVFQDSDLMKWIEAAAYTLAEAPDEKLAQQVDALVATMRKAQQPDGYLNSYYIINGLEKRFTNLKDCHELYCLGHMIEGAVAYFDATGKRDFLDIACRFADLADSLFGREEGKRKGYPGHEEVELALVKLYQATGEARYLNLAAYFVDQRGAEPNYFVQEWQERGRMLHWKPTPTSSVGSLEYHQAHVPVREQTEAAGHAVRAVYLYTGMAAVARHNGDRSLIEACERLWRNLVDRQLYITGGIGQTHHGEAFTFDYDLPNDTVYSETCAAIGLVFFAHEMLQIQPKAEYADVLERALYNTILAGMAKDGQHFFYVNPLETWPAASQKDPGKRHVKAERQAWFGCSCCPPNVARLLASLGKYIYSQQGDDLYVHLFIGSEVNLGGVRLVQRTQYPWEGKVEITLHGAQGARRAVHVRMPGWCAAPRVCVNGEAADTTRCVHGYLAIERLWEDGDRIEVELPMHAQLMRANPQVRADAGKAAVVRGPLVYCAEETDNGGNISALRLDAKASIEGAFDADLLGGAVVLKTQGRRDAASTQALYFPLERDTDACTEITLVPYYLWGNRGLGEMAVWLPVRW